MKIKHKKNKISYIIGAILIALIAVAYYFFFYTPKQSGTDNKTNNTPATDVNKSRSSSNDSNTNPVDKTPKQFDLPKNTDSVSETNNLGVIVNTLTDESTLYVRTTISELLGEGSCKLTLTNKTTLKTIVLTSGIVTSASSSSCDGWNIPLNTLYSGTWQTNVVVNSGDKRGVGSHEVNI